MNLVKENYFAIDNKSLTSRNGGGITSRILGLLTLVALALLGGCETEDCVNCIELPPPVVPTGVHSISGDNSIIVQWYDISYHPYDGNYNANVESYYIYSRYFEDGDEYNADREFVLIGEVAWNGNFDPTSGLHWFDDTEAVNGYRYEYAVAAVNSAGSESALSYELVTDAPLYHSLAPVRMYDIDGDNPHLSGFDFSLMDYGLNASHLGFNADIELHFEGGIPYIHTSRSAVLVQDFGVFTNSSGQVIFEGVSWAPADGYSNTGVLELIEGHIYVVEISEYPHGTHYAKFGVTQISAGSVEIIWAYQSIAGLPELSVPDGKSQPADSPEIISL